MKKEIHVAFITEKLKDEFNSLKSGKFEDEQLYKFIYGQKFMSRNTE